ncbi:DUF2267 domain-containing protein [Kibdelosporangium lantanae]
MSQTGFAPFTTTVDKTNHILRQIEVAYGWGQDRRPQSYAALRAALHALRDRLIVAEAAQLAAQLPMLVRGIYYEGWVPSRVPVKMDREQFVQRVRTEFRYDVEGGMEQLVRTVIGALRPQISDGEWHDVKSVMPKDLAAAMP